MMEKPLSLPKWMFVETLEHIEICPACGKEFNRYTPDWGLKYGSKDVCSYNCMRKMEREDPKSYEYKKIHGETKTRKDPEPLTDVQISAIKRMYAMGATYETIAKALKRSTGTIASAVKRLGLKQRGSTGLPQEKVDRIKSMWQEGINGYQIAKQLNIVTSTVYKYVNGMPRGEKENQPNENQA